MGNALFEGSNQEEQLPRICDAGKNRKLTLVSWSDSLLAIMLIV